MTRADIERDYPRHYVAQLARLVCALADDEQVTVGFALQVWGTWAPPAALPLELFPPERFGAVH
jgi:hypothetical protein